MPSPFVRPLYISQHLNVIYSTLPLKYFHVKTEQEKKMKMEKNQVKAPPRHVIIKIHTHTYRNTYSSYLVFISIFFQIISYFRWKKVYVLSLSHNCLYCSCMSQGNDGVYFIFEDHFLRWKLLRLYQYGCDSNLINFEITFLVPRRPVRNEV